MAEMCRFTHPIWNIHPDVTSSIYKLFIFHKIYLQASVTIDRGCCGNDIKYVPACDKWLVHDFCFPSHSSVYANHQRQHQHQHHYYPSTVVLLFFSLFSFFLFCYFFVLRNNESVIVSSTKVWCVYKDTYAQHSNCVFITWHIKYIISVE